MSQNSGNDNLSLNEEPDQPKQKSFNDSSQTPVINEILVEISEKEQSIDSDDPEIIQKLKKKSEVTIYEDKYELDNYYEKPKQEFFQMHIVNDNSSKMVEAATSLFVDSYTKEVLNRDLFEQKSYKPFFDNSVIEEYEDFVYLIQRGKCEEVITMYQTLNFNVKEQQLRPTGETIMHCCAEYGQLQLFEFFREKGGNVMSQNYADESPLHVAAREGKVEIIRHYIQSLKDEIDINHQMMDGWSALFYAAINGYLISVEILVKEGHCDINHRDNYKRTALHWVVRYNNKSMVKKLLDLGINFGVQDTEDMTAYDIAKLHSNYDVAQLISSFQSNSKNNRNGSLGRRKI